MSDGEHACCERCTYWDEQEAARRPEVGAELRGVIAYLRGECSEPLDVDDGSPAAVVLSELGALKSERDEWREAAEAVTPLTVCNVLNRLDGGDSLRDLMDTVKACDEVQGVDGLCSCARVAGAMLADRDRWRRQAAELAAVVGVGGDQPWPLADVLEKLSEAAEHLLRDHDCDAHGYEQVYEALRAAREYAPVVRAGLEGS